eukprot:TRINITY_DN23207_c0_g1_i1.p1 TRINITY_DN23207_c0_g1~~TRINITY_DN23207_c0_g1_i1.p1  ORF type:complete len:200 (+),score=48.66 TRINITY_DN23207_c0_g1_i1:73-672(+)
MGVDLAGGLVAGDPIHVNSAQGVVVGPPARAACARISVSVRFDDGSVRDVRVSEIACEAPAAAANRPSSQGNGELKSLLELEKEVGKISKSELPELEKVFKKARLVEVEIQLKALESKVDAIAVKALQGDEGEQARTLKRNLTKSLERAFAKVDELFQGGSENLESQSKSLGGHAFAPKRSSGPLASRCANCGLHRDAH